MARMTVTSQQHLVRQAVLQMQKVHILSYLYFIFSPDCYLLQTLSYPHHHLHPGPVAPFQGHSLMR